MERCCPFQFIDKNEHDSQFLKGIVLMLEELLLLFRACSLTQAHSDEKKRGVLNIQQKDELVENIRPNFILATLCPERWQNPHVGGNLFNNPSPKLCVALDIRWVRL